MFSHEQIKVIDKLFPAPDNNLIIRRLTARPDRLRAVIDTDTFNEIDDQFAIAYALASQEKIQVQAIYAVPFRNNKVESPALGMESSYDEILRLLQLITVPHQDFVFRGASVFLEDVHHPVNSPAVEDLIRRARAAQADDPLYIIAIGALTNIASAFLLAPDIISKTVVVWLGGNPLYWDHTNEYNLSQDPLAARIVFDCGVPLVQVPCWGVTSHLLTSVPELTHTLGGKNRLCDFLIGRVAEHHDDHFAWGKEIWDVAPVAYLLDEAFTPSVFVSSPYLTPQLTWSHMGTRHLMKTVQFVNRNAIFGDLFRKLISYP